MCRNLDLADLKVPPPVNQSRAVREFFLLGLVGSLLFIVMEFIVNTWIYEARGHLASESQVHVKCHILRQTLVMDWINCRMRNKTLSRIFTLSLRGDLCEPWRRTDVSLRVRLRALHLLYNGGKEQPDKTNQTGYSMRGYSAHCNSLCGRDPT